jgi:hypothetical protein
MLYFRLFMLALLCVAVIMILTGCTLKFKATEMEYDGELSGKLKLDGIDVAGVRICGFSAPRPRFDCCEPARFYAKSSKETR